MLTSDVFKTAALPSPSAACVTFARLHFLLSLYVYSAAQHALHRRESDEGAGKGAIAGAWATKKDLLETKKVSRNAVR